MGISYKTWVEIDTGVLRANLGLLREAVGPDCQTILVVKSDAYGHGAHTVASVAAEEGIRRFAVASVSEGVALRKMAVPGEIIILHPVMEFEVEAAIRDRLSPTVSDFTLAKTLSDHVRNTLGIQVEVNTGINRLGLDWKSAAEVITRIAALPNIRIEGVFTHFRASGDAGNGSVSTQMARFQGILEALRKRNIDIGLTHAASSHAVARYRSSHLDGVRPGMIIYAGVGESEASNAKPPDPIISPLGRMRGVMRAYSRVLMTRSVAAGEWIHYGDAFQAPRDMEVAVIAIGYGMGYPRSLSNNADMLLAGRRVPVVGVIGMDMTIVAIDGLPRILPGDIATIMGTDGDETITIHEVARRAGTIPYEIACRLGNALPRVVKETETADKPKALSVSRNAVS
ncbi:MAG: alanine racemase [Candidatus Zixiibacteriota bacterium]